MKTIRVGSRSSCPSEPGFPRRVHRAAALFSGMRRLFLRVILRRLKEPPECADGEPGTPRSFNRSRSSASVMSALGGHSRKDQLGMRLDPLQMAVAALALGPDIALALFLSPPADRA